MQAVQNFRNLFEDENKIKLYCLSSGTPTPKEVENDLFGADKTGQAAYMQFVRERLLERRVNFNDPIKKLKLKAFTKTAKTVKFASKSKKTKHITAERNVFSQLVMIAIKNNISLERVLQFPLGPVPWSLAMNDSTPAKADKLRLKRCLERGSHVSEKPDADKNIYIIDGNAMFLSQVAFGELCLFSCQTCPMWTMSQIRTSITQSKASRETREGRLLHT
jgi:hypothetical protein